MLLALALIIGGPAWAAHCAHGKEGRTTSRSQVEAHAMCSAKLLRIMI